MKIKSIIWKLVGIKLPYIATGKPSTIHILNMLLPIIFPTKISCSFFIADIIDVTSSGNDVPNATIVNAITIFGTLKFSASEDAPSTNMSAPLINNTNPTTNKIMYRNILSLPINIKNIYDVGTISSGTILLHRYFYALLNLTHFNVLL